MGFSKASFLWMLVATTLAALQAQALDDERHHLAKGPFGLPSLRVLEEKLELSHKQKEHIHRLYVEYRHKEHGRHHLSGSNESLRKELISKIEAILSSTQRPIFLELIKHHGAHVKGT